MERYFQCIRLALRLQIQRQNSAGLKSLAVGSFTLDFSFGDLLNEEIVLRSLNEQESFTGRDGDLKVAVRVAYDGGVQTRNDRIVSMFAV